MALVAKLLHVVEAVSSVRHDFQRWHRAMQGLASPCRMASGAQSRCRNVVSDPAVNLLYLEEPWSALPRPGRTKGAMSLAFIMISSTVCGLEQLLLTLQEWFPYRLFLRNHHRAMKPWRWSS